MIIHKVINHLKSGTFLTTLLRKTLYRGFFLSEKNVFQKQEKALNSILEYCVKNCEFYKDVAPNILNFPLVDKEIITENYNKFLSKSLKKYVYSDAYTGGSTGEPFHFLRSGNYEYQFGKRKWIEYGFKDGDTIFAMDGTVISSDSRVNNVYWVKVSNDNIPFGSVAMSSLYLNDSTAIYYCKYLREKKPNFLRGYPSFIYELALYFEKLGYNVWDELKAIELTSEVVQKHQLEKIRQVFVPKVFLQYGHSEACVFAYTYDDTYRYKVEPLYGYIEILDINGKHVKENEEGEVVVTTLHNRVMPLVRYKTGDTAVYGGRDERYVYLNAVLGRKQDYIYAKDYSKISLTSLIFAQHIRAMSNIIRWQLEQYEKGKVELHIIKGCNYSINDEKEILELFNKIGNVDVDFDYVNNIEQTKRGKSRMLIQHILE